MDGQVISAVAFPLFLAIGGIAAWRMTRKKGSFDEPEKPTWRDDSLDDWRRERDAQLEEERQKRAQDAGSRLRTGQEEQQETQQKTHTRLGG